METLIISCLLGSIAGIVLGLTGAGGAILAVPLLIFGLGMNMSEAVPIALLAVCLSATIGALIGLKQGRVRYRAAGLIALTGALAAPVGFWLSQQLPHEPLTLLFALVLTYVAISMLRKKKSSGHDVQTDVMHLHPYPEIPCMLGSNTGRLIWTWPCARALALSGTLAGFLSGLLGVGGGFVVVPALNKVTLLQMQAILATSLAVIALVSAVGTASAVLFGTMNWWVAAPFALGALAGMMIGFALSTRFSGTKLQQGFAWMAICVALAMVFKLFV
ncbi:MAG TPA: sulfite exporter TauE/SafE family protein [Nitrosomonas sp.]|nr:sulfite exporter TauE/SafE family protein [Nitrosomonas sp.]